MKRILVLLAGNFLVFGALVFVVNFVVISIGQVLDWRNTMDDDRARLPNYVGVDWAGAHFREFWQLATGYRSYYGWRRLPYHGRTITIDESGTRRTFAPANNQQARKIAFFGGSTMWGSGADDEHTIPSLFIKQHPDYLGYNFAESGHTSHQNLNLLMEKLLEGLRPDVVVFYNGVNEVGLCRRELRVYSHERDAQIRELVDDRPWNFRNPKSYLSLLYPAKAFVDRMGQALERRWAGPHSFFNCDQEPEKAAAVARLLLWDWTAAKDLVEGYGGKFLAVLQPVVYFSHTRTDHIIVEEELRPQYAAVYPRIIDLLQSEFPQLRGNFLDLRDAFDQDMYIYIDSFHVSPNGNQIIASRISSQLASEPAGRGNVSH